MDSQVQMIGDAELQVIQATLRVDPDGDAALRTIAQEPLDWQRVQHLATYHGVLPLVHKRLAEVAPDLVPPEAMHEMAAFQKANELRTFQMTTDLIRVVRALETEGIPVLCLKGPTLASLAHGDPALRYFGDLDILVQASDFRRAETLLNALGLAPVTNKDFPTFETTDRELATRRERQFAFPHRRYHLDVHWGISTPAFPRALGTTGLFARSRKVTVGGQLLSTLCDDDLAIHLCHHGTFHCWERLLDVADFSAALLAIGLEQWEALLATARKQGLYRPMLVGVLLCRDLLGIALPEKIARTCSCDLISRWIVRSLQAHYSRPSEYGQASLHELALTLLTPPKRTHDILALVISMFRPTVRDHRWVDLPPHLRWLYPVLRPVRRTLGILRAAFRLRDGAVTRAVAGNQHRRQR